MKATISEEIRNLIKHNLEVGYTVTQLSKMFDVSRTTIYSIKNDKEIKQRSPKSKSDNKQFILQVKKAIRKLKKSKKTSYFKPNPSEFAGCTIFINCSKMPKKQQRVLLTIHEKKAKINGGSKERQG